ncbi:pantoate--beta-alanine ligase [Bacillus thermophilus]|uniref:Pantothenate synthetase n=1 Tax=Siminovitchia thermophila TaxID=1245522 RepID=A0ABS2R2K4_9BACI|nr:pantoate--beta-alanine ligase [Siminovitchia thermophila]MBM7713610.1 pantoate--beta-alanine ligase [Siminovitchia thermophila]ONK21923.1 pantoate--beta-alanine ligase [Bacillus sp. VT-16-64]
MKIITEKKEMQQMAKQLQSKGKTIGFVPTMGYLHEGHLTLVRKAKKENDIVVMSIFVNPLQFGPDEDYEAYPRDQKRDERLAETTGVDLLFIPNVSDMYDAELSTKMSVVKRNHALCGNDRPGHFDGVVTVLAKLFHIVMPDKAYFGLKDAQQFAVVAGMVADYDFPVQLIPVETVRDANGLAVSSRNVYLSAREKEQAPCIYKSLLLAKHKIEQGATDVEEIKSAVIDFLKSRTDALIDYVDILSYPELQPLEQIHGRIIIAIAVKFSKARLIDNIIFDVS